MRTMPDPAHSLSSSKECQGLKTMLQKLKYSETFILFSDIRRFLRAEPLIISPWKTQKSADSLSPQLSDLRKKVDRVCSCFDKKKISKKSGKRNWLWTLKKTPYQQTVYLIMYILLFLSLVFLHHALYFNVVSHFPFFIYGNVKQFSLW